MQEDGTYSYATGGGRDSGDIATVEKPPEKILRRKKKKKKKPQTFKEWLKEKENQ